MSRDVQIYFALGSNLHKITSNLVETYRNLNTYLDDNAISLAIYDGKVFGYNLFGYNDVYPYLINLHVNSGNKVYKNHVVRNKPSHVSLARTVVTEENPELLKLVKLFDEQNRHAAMLVNIFPRVVNNTFYLANYICLSKAVLAKEHLLEDNISNKLTVDTYIQLYKDDTFKFSNQSVPMDVEDIVEIMETNLIEKLLI